MFYLFFLDAIKILYYKWELLKFSIVLVISGREFAKKGMQ